MPSKSKAAKPAARKPRSKRPRPPSAASASAAAGPAVAAVFKPELLGPASSTSALAALFAEAKPYPHLFVEGVFDDDVLRQAKEELLGGEWFRKRVDLYDFLQTDHLRHAGASGAVARIQNALYGPDFRRWIEGVTGLRTLAEPLDTSAAQYAKGGHLLCHDDDLSGRVIAFIVYLVDEDWTAEDGGALDLYDCDPATGFPCAVSKSLVPKWNSLAFFAVTPGSFHQVAEVLTSTKGSRMSISGWFHGKAPPRPGPLPLPVPTFRVPSRVRSRLAPGLLLADGAAATTSAGSDDEGGDEDDESEEVTLDLELLSRWVEPKWLAIAVSGVQMQEHFAEHGSIELAPFLKETAYGAALKAMRVQSWIAVGPPHLRQYRVAASCNSEAASLLAGTESSSSSSAAVAAASAAPSHAARVPVAAAPAPPQVASALSLAAVAAAQASDDASSPLAASSKASAAAADAVSEYAHANRLAGGPGTRWREQSAAVPDAATLLWQMLDSREFADFLAVLTGAGTVATWAVEARAIGQGSYTLVTDPELKRARRRKGAPEDSSEEPAAKRGAASAGTVVAPALTPDGSRESSVAGESDEEEDDPLRIEACFCMLDPFPGVDADEPWPEEAGGYTVMLTSDEELCTVEPTSNSLSVLGVPPGATTFVKFVTASAPGVRYDVCMRANIE
ncbi:hypothetical protein FNF29_03013 [Cafeteria roenbergensis]|uniref:Fe2OG dioxygenase domain-containing protein n=1 Tax=Cafeteria roenbergensis TaxID=33653 RepID=A0A5A8CKS2_CAFRO|nr:hypothetical protein FNF29_03013 [Cafeteria roenbergensis]|eukprot:KAA0153625.1 hypothetical protein FNF29_03013 [Cafeteria roenbergensis]